jgi:Holliday junction resolvase RusA-like endonuclease
MAELKAFIHDIRPLSHQSVRVVGRGSNKPRFYQPAKVKKYQLQIQMKLKMMGIKAKLKGPLRVVRLVYHYKTPIKKLQGTIKFTRPDLNDNLNKPFFDALTRGGFIEDDGRIGEFLLLRKIWSDHNGIEIHIEEID